MKFSRSSLRHARLVLPRDSSGVRSRGGRVLECVHVHRADSGRSVVDRSRRRPPAVGADRIEEATPQLSPSAGTRWPFAAGSDLGLRRFRLDIRARGVQLSRRRHGRDVRVLELGAFLALEDRTAIGEARGLVGRVGELALGVGLGQRAAVLHQLEQTAGVVVGGHAGGTAAERRQLPRLRRLDGRALGRREAHAGEVCNVTNRPR